MVPAGNGVALLLVDGVPVDAQVCQPADETAAGILNVEPGPLLVGRPLTPTQPIRQGELGGVLNAPCSLDRGGGSAEAKQPPPEIAVAPPISGSRSAMAAVAPCSFASNAAARPAPPEPTTITSTFMGSCWTIRPLQISGSLTLSQVLDLIISTPLAGAQRRAESLQPTDGFA